MSPPSLPQPSPPTPTALPARVRRGYALGGVATGSFGTVPGLMLLPYLTERLGVPAALAGVIVFAPKAWDVILNPIAGRISDHSTHPDGPRRPFLLRAGLALAVAFALLFAGPASPQALAAGWVAVLFLACATAYAFFQVPYVAMPAELTDSPRERTRIMSLRVAVLALAILISGGLAPMVRTMVGPERGYAVMGLFVAVLIAVGALGAWWGDPWRASAGRCGCARRSAQPIGARRKQSQLPGADPHLHRPSSRDGAMLAGVDYVARHVLRDPGAGSVLFVCFVAPAIVCTPLWERLAARLGKRRAYAAASLTLAAGAAALVAARVMPAALVYVAVAVVGVGYAGAQMLPLSMLPDVAAADAAESGENRVGVFTGVWTAGETLGMALGPFVFGLVLAAGGYVSSTDSTAAQPDSAVMAIVLGFSVLPALLTLASLFFLRGYSPPMPRGFATYGPESEVDRP
jgi:GPH family glycoside/pentoside/hexuronide:cation symporter